MSNFTVERQEFQQWFRKYWGGISLEWLEGAEEYKETAAQTAWEAWRRSWPDKEPRDTKIWYVSMAARYRRGSLIESYDHSMQSSPGMAMVEYADYAVMFKVIEHYEKELQDLVEKLKVAKVYPYYQEPKNG